MANGISRVEGRDASGPTSGRAAARIVAWGAKAGRWLVCAYLALSAVSGVWLRQVLEADWPVLSMARRHPVVAILVAAGLVLIGACALVEWHLERRPVYAGRPRLAAGSLAVLASGLALLLLAVLAAPAAPSPEAAWGGTEHLAVALQLGLLAYIARPRPSEVSLAAGAALAVHGGVGIAQFLLQSTVGLGTFGELPALDLRFRGVSVVDVDGHHWLRAYGLSAHPNVLGGFLAVGLLLVIGALASQAVPRRLRPALWAAVALGSAGLLLTFSRAAWIAFAAGFVILAWTHRHAVHMPRGRERYMLAAVAIAALCTVAAVSPLIATRVTGGGSELEARSIEERQYYISAGWQLFLQAPWHGAGVDNSALAVRGFLGDSHVPVGNAFVHNVALMAAIELGAPGGLIWIALGLLGVLVTWRVIQRSARLGMPPDGWAMAVGAAWLALWVVALFDYYPWSSLRNGMIWPLLLGLWVANWPELLARKVTRVWTRT